MMYMAQNGETKTNQNYPSGRRVFPGILLPTVRTFKIDNVLALVPIVLKESMVI